MYDFAVATSHLSQLFRITNKTKQSTTLHGYQVRVFLMTALLGISFLRLQAGPPAFHKHGGEPTSSAACSSAQAAQDHEPVLHGRNDHGVAGQKRQPDSDGADGVGPARPGDESNGKGSRFALSFTTSTLGLGSQAALRIHGPFNLRVGVSGFNYRRSVADSGIVYDAAFRLRSVSFVVDWFPTSKSLHLTPGLLVYDRNRVSANAVVPINQVVSAGGEQFVSDPKNPITGTARSTMRAVAPMMTVGFGNLLPRTRHIGFTFDVGVVFQGEPAAEINLNGSACDASRGHCRDVATDNGVQADIDAGRKTMQDDLSIMRFYPVISVGVGYRF